MTFARPIQQEICMSQFPRALYLAGGNELIDGEMFTSVVVRDAEQMEVHLSAGWRRSTGEALESADSPVTAEADVTRAELERKAIELGIKFDGRTSDKKLAHAIDLALAK